MRKLLPWILIVLLFLVLIGQTRSRRKPLHRNPPDKPAATSAAPAPITPPPPPQTAPQAPPAQGRSLAEKLKPCHVPDVDEEVLCGRYEVYENRTARKGRKIGLNIVVLPAKSSDVAADPIVF